MNRAVFFAELRKRDSGLFGTSLKQHQVDGVEAILDAAAGLHISYVAYCLATAYHETGRTMKPVRETFATTDEAAIGRLERAWSRGKLPWVKAPYWRKDAAGRTWLGRGYVQLTHRANYEKAAALVQADLVGNPALAMVPKIAARVLVEGSEIGMFTGKRLADYLPGDYRSARAIINGDKNKKVGATTMGTMIANYARDFENALTAAEWGRLPPVLRPPGPPDPLPTQPARNPLTALWAALRGIFRKA